MGTTADSETIRRAIMLSMSFTSMEPVVFDHVNGSVGSWTHDDYDVAHAELTALVARAEQADTYREALELIADPMSANTFMAGYRADALRQIACAALLVQESSKVTE